MPHHPVRQTLVGDRTNGPIPSFGRVSDHPLSQRLRSAHPLLLTTAQHILPLLTRIPSALTSWQVRQVHGLENFLQVFQRLAALPELRFRVWVDDPGAFQCQRLRHVDSRSGKRTDPSSFQQPCTPAEVRQTHRCTLAQAGRHSLIRVPRGQQVLGRSPSCPLHSAFSSAPFKGSIRVHIPAH